MFRRRSFSYLHALLGRFTARRRRTIETARDTPGDRALAIDHVDDPDAPMRLIRAAGVVDPDSIERLIAQWQHVMAPFAIHLDLFDAMITDASTARRLESALDHLERQQIAVRIVGLDPSHPAIAS